MRRLGTFLWILLLPIARRYVRGSTRAYVVLVAPDGIVCVQNWLARPTWRMPGGGVKPGEQVAEAACREVREELGIVVDPSLLVEISSGKVSTDGLDHSFVLFRAHIPVSTMSPHKLEIYRAETCQTLPEPFLEDIRSAVEAEFATLSL